jgi:hypothetical protein
MPHKHKRKNPDRLTSPLCHQIIRAMAIGALNDVFPSELMAHRRERAAMNIRVPALSLFRITEKHRKILRGHIPWHQIDTE